MTEEADHLRELVAEVAGAYFSNSHVAVADIPTVISQIAASLTAVGAAAPVEAAAQPEAEQVKLTAAQIRKSITPDVLVSFEDGKTYKTLRRHLSTYNLTPEQYREKWGLPGDYPMVAPNYSAVRSAMAKSLGLGQLRRKPAEAAAAPKVPAKRGRPRKS